MFKKPVSSRGTKASGGRRFFKAGEHYLCWWLKLIWAPVTFGCRCVQNVREILVYDEYPGACVGIESAHFKSLAQKFFLRGRQFFVISVFLLCACGICVGLGVGAFLYPTYFTDISSKDARLKELQEKVAENIEKQRVIESKTKFDSEFKDALAPFRALYEHVTIKTGSYERDPTSIIRYEPPVLFGNVTAYLSALKAENDSFRLQLENNEFAESGPQQIGESVLGKVRGLVVNKHGTIASLLEDVREIKLAAQPDSVKKVMQRLAGIEASLKWVVDEYNAASEQLRQSEELEKEFIDQKFALQSENAQLGLESAKLIAEQVLSEQRHAWERWAPVLSIRVGVVILFLFLTRILLETYRYTTALSAFYRARGDAIQLLGEGTTGQPVDPEVYAAFLISLAPENHSIDKIDSPENHLLALIRPGLVSRETQVDGGE